VTALWANYSSSNDGEDGDDNDDGDGSGSDDDNNRGNNCVDGGIYSLEGHIQGLSLSDQYYGVRYGYDYRPQLKRSMSTSIGLSTFHRDDYDDDFVSQSQFNVEITTVACIYEYVLCNLLYCACILICFY